MYHLIDPPVGPYSSPNDIQDWIEELRRQEQTPEVRAAIEEAMEYLKESISHQQQI